MQQDDATYIHEAATEHKKNVDDEAVQQLGGKEQAACNNKEL